MSNTTYYLAWLGAGLAIVAGLSGAITWHLRWRALRRVKAAQLLEAIEGYTVWIAAQRRAALFGGDATEGESPLREARLIQREWFPELCEEAAQLLEVHARFIDFMWSQQLLRLRDAEAWIESDEDARFMLLWRLHRGITQAVADRVKAIVGDAGSAGLEAEAVFPASGAGRVARP